MADKQETWTHRLTEEGTRSLLFPVGRFCCLTVPCSNRLASFAFSVTVQPRSSEFGIVELAYKLTTFYKPSFLVSVKVRPHYFVVGIEILTSVLVVCSPICHHPATQVFQEFFLIPPFIEDHSCHNCWNHMPIAKCVMRFRRVRSSLCKCVSCFD